MLFPRFVFGDFKGPTITGVETASFSLTRGVRPSVCQVVMPFNKNLRRGPFPMTFSDGVRKATFRDCIVNDVTSVDSDGQTMSIAILDRRWRWTYPTISGTYNVKKAGNAFVTGTKRDCKELARLLLKELGEKPQDFDLSNMPDDVYPYVNWDVTRAGPALEALCREVNCHVCLCVDDKVRIFRDGVGRELPDVPSLTKSLGFEFGHRPGSVGVCSGLVSWQLDFALEPVGIELDGSIKPIEELSYAPYFSRWTLFEVGRDSEGKTIIKKRKYYQSPDVRTWSQYDPISFDEVENPLPLDLTEQVTPEDRKTALNRKLIVETIWRWYRVRAVRFSPGLSSSSFKMPWTDGVEVKDLQQFYPLLPSQLEYAPLDGSSLISFNTGGYEQTSRERKSAIVWGRFYDEDTDSDDPFSANIQSLPDFPDLDFYETQVDEDGRGDIELTELAIENMRIIYQKSFSIDYDRGIVKFADPVYLQKFGFNNKDIRTVPANIFLRTSCHLRDFDTRAGYRRFLKKKIPGAPDTSITHWVVKDDVKPEWKKNMYGAEVNNEKKVDEQLQFYLDQEIAKFESRVPGSMNIPELFLASPDGKIAQVVFDIDQTGYISTSINKEIEGLLNAPDYSERSFLLKVEKLEEQLNKNSQQTPPIGGARQ